MLQGTVLPQARWLEQRRRQQQQHSKPISICPAPCAVDCSGRDECNTQGFSSNEQGQIRNVVIATAMCCVFASNVRAARAESQNWVPRRHHRHIGERFTDTWADTIVEVTCDCLISVWCLPIGCVSGHRYSTTVVSQAEHATAARVRDLERQVEQERKRADVSVCCYRHRYQHQCMLRNAISILATMLLHMCACPCAE